MVQFAEKRRAAMDAVMKDEVYRCAVEVLTDQGPQALTMDRLAKAVGVSRGTLYNYFSDREAVLTYVDEQAIEPFLQATETIVVGEGTAEEKLYRHTLSVLQYVESSQPLLFALLMKEAAEGARLEAQIRRYDRMLAMLIKIFQQGIKSREFRTLPLPDCAVIFMSAVRGHVEYMVEHEIQRPPEEVASMLMGVIMPAFRTV